MNKSHKIDGVSLLKLAFQFSKRYEGGFFSATSGRAIPPPGKGSHTP
jgi:hypothetical protein